ncbi:hypothetical protein EDB86DRAFT_2831593 [Lactarius hatsudake]|nr:hypothetical protein EDB86DRAFT_2831593 [Lactarius hatsudake]
MHCPLVSVLLLTVFAPLFGVVYAAPNAPPDIQLRGQISGTTSSVQKATLKRTNGVDFAIMSHAHATHRPLPVGTDCSSASRAEVGCTVGGHCENKKDMAKEETGGSEQGWLL